MTDKRIEKVRGSIDEKIAACVVRAHTRQACSADVIFLSELLRFYRAELYANLGRIQGVGCDLEFNETLELRRHTNIGAENSQ